MCVFCIIFSWTGSTAELVDQPNREAIHGSMGIPLCSVLFTRVHVSRSLEAIDLVQPITARFCGDLNEYHGCWPATGKACCLILRAFVRWTWVDYTVAWLSVDAWSPLLLFCNGDKRMSRLSRQNLATNPLRWSLVENIFISSSFHCASS